MHRGRTGLSVSGFTIWFILLTALFGCNSQAFDLLPSVTDYATFRIEVNDALSGVTLSTSYGKNHSGDDLRLEIQQLGKPTEIVPLSLKQVTALHETVRRTLSQFELRDSSKLLNSTEVTDTLSITVANHGSEARFSYSIAETAQSLPAVNLLREMLGMCPVKVVPPIEWLRLYSLPSAEKVDQETLGADRKPNKGER